MSAAPGAAPRGAEDAPRGAAAWPGLSPWPRRALDALSTYLPLLLMAGVALGTWWLVKNTPLFEDGRPTAPPRHEPDYTMTQFLVQRFAADGSMRVQIEGELLRHYPDTDTFEVDRPRIRAVADDGRVTTATAREALANRNGSEVQLRGEAHVVRDATATESAIDFKGPFLQYFQYSEQVRSHLPVVVTQAGTELRADAMNYDNLARVLDLKGRVHAVLPPAGARRPAGAVNRPTGAATP